MGLLTWWWGQIPHLSTVMWELRGQKAYDNLDYGSANSHSLPLPLWAEFPPLTHRHWSCPWGLLRTVRFTSVMWAGARRVLVLPCLALALHWPTMRRTCSRSLYPFSQGPPPPGTHTRGAHLKPTRSPGSRPIVLHARAEPPSLDQSNHSQPADAWARE